MVALTNARIACLARAPVHRVPILEPPSPARDRAAFLMPSLHMAHDRGR